MAKQVWGWFITGLSKCKFDRLVFFICLFLSIGLMTFSIVSPPKGIIDKSVLAGVAELFAFAALSAGMDAISRGKEVEVTHKDTTLTIGDMADIQHKHYCDKHFEEDVDETQYDSKPDGESETKPDYDS